MTKHRRQFAMVQRETLEFFAAYRYHKRKNENKTRTEDPVLFLELTKLDDIGLTRPGMAELMVHSMLCTYRNARTGTCWVSQATIARKCRLSESSVSTAFKWLIKAKLIRKMDNVRVARKIVMGGAAKPVTLLTIFDLPFYRWVDEPAYGSVETEAQESWERSKTKAKLDAQGIDTEEYWGGDRPVLGEVNDG